MSGKKRGNGEGSIYHRADGRWHARLTLQDGRRKDFYGMTRAEVSRKMAEAIRDRDKGLHAPTDDRLRLAPFLDEWLDGKKATLRPRTWLRYRELLRHVTATLGGHQLTRITPRALQRLYADLQAMPPDGAGLSSTTVHHAHTALRQAFASAERQGLIARNPADLLDAPRMAESEMQVLTLTQAKTLLATAQGDKLEAIITLALTTGMRLGELLGLQWRDVDLTRASLQVRNTMQRVPGEGWRLGPPKTARSRRRIDLAPEGVAALRRHHARQAEDRLAAGALWESSADAPDLVFANAVGRPIEGANFLRRDFAPLLARAGLPRVRFHDLRHTAATLLLEQGIHPKIVAEMLGHSDISLTMNRYSHAVPTMQRDAVSKLNDALFG
ncbi:MAG TPA: tyrosine-type recombinase/integrase [Ktedonobacterales bacterium]|nr:tyrosine-type recombinase/integrase [Ktedonobacterales bacterium]